MKYFSRFNDIGKDYVYTDKHIHSVWTDGKLSIPQIACRARQMRLKQIAIVDHIRKDSDYFNEYLKEIKQASRSFGIEILAGLKEIQCFCIIGF